MSLFAATARNSRTTAFAPSPRTGNAKTTDPDCPSINEVVHYLTEMLRFWKEGIGI